MTRYSIELMPTALRAALTAARHIAKDSPQNAARWFAELNRAIDSLDVFPHRCGRAREADFVNEDLRQYIYGFYRIVFSIDEASKIVRVLYIRHSAQRAIGEASDDFDTGNAP